MHSVWHPYCGAAPIPAELASRWNFDPFLLLALVAAGAAFFLLVSAEKRSDPTFAAAMGVALLLFVSPFCAWTSALFSVRAVHHLLLQLVLAPLLVLSIKSVRMPGPLALWTGLQAIVFWFWHAPPVYAAALSSTALYWAMQISILGTAVLFWASVARASAPAGVAALLVTTVAMGLLGALLTFAGEALYAPHFASTQPWGLSPLEDQQLAGLIMWAPGGGFYLAAALLLAARWMRREQMAAAS